eukprot:7942517-Pyramimonas_sp.AAC.2
MPRSDWTRREKNLLRVLDRPQLDDSGYVIETRFLPRHKRTATANLASKEARYTPIANKALPFALRADALSRREGAMVFGHVPRARGPRPVGTETGF